jgi:hypothetical protein
LVSDAVDGNTVANTRFFCAFSQGLICNIFVTYFVTYFVTACRYNNGPGDGFVNAVREKVLALIKQ